MRLDKMILCPVFYWIKEEICVGNETELSVRIGHATTTENYEDDANVQQTSNRDSCNCAILLSYWICIGRSR